MVADFGAGCRGNVLYMYCCLKMVVCCVLVMFNDNQEKSIGDRELTRSALGDGSISPSSAKLHQAPGETASKIMGEHDQGLSP